MTRRPDTLGARSVELRKVNGKRAKEGYNVEEAEAILKEINEDRQGARPRSRRTSAPASACSRPIATR